MDLALRWKVTPAAEGHGLWPWMNAPAFGRDVAPLGREIGCHGLCPWGSTLITGAEESALVRQWPGAR
jgi:hypothetical protein